jgi:hypothetical protein
VLTTISFVRQPRLTPRPFLLGLAGGKHRTSGCDLAHITVV